MKKDIPELKVEDLAIAIVPRAEADIEEEASLWETYIINLKEEPLKSVFVNAHGFGEIDGESRQTTRMRYFFEELPPLEAVFVEAIHPAVFQFTNQYWVSFQFDNYMYDKKYIFVQGSIDVCNFTLIPFLDRKGVMIR